jgi:cation:H+ antiporter
MLINIALYILAFVFIWLGSGLIVSSTSKFSSKLGLSSFAFSFIFLGILTSIPEFSVGLQAIADNDAEIFVGNLLGGVAVIFLLVIPVLAIFGNGIQLRGQIDRSTLLISLGVMLAPAILVLDKKVTNPEGIILILLYLLLLVIVQRKNGIFDTEKTDVLQLKAYSYIDLIKIVLGIGMVFIASNVIVDKTMYFADYFAISAFYIGLIVIAVGTNLPELSIAIRSVLSGKKDVAMGDYIGSASANTLLFGIFTLLHNGEVITINNFYIIFLFLLFGLLGFYYFAKSKSIISRNEGIMLLSLYAIFLVFELFFRNV